MTNPGPDATATKEPQVGNRCFGCGVDNPEGMHLKFAYDEARKRFVCRFSPDVRFTGPPGYLHGGLIATILDEIMGKFNKLHQTMTMTREMTVEYLRPVPLGKVLVAEAFEESVRGRVHFRGGEIRSEAGDLLARSRGKFVAVDRKNVERPPDAAELAAILGPPVAKK